MRHKLFALAASTFLAVMAGCACNNNCCNRGNSCPPAGCAGRGCAGGPAAGQQGGPTGVVSYPYYTVRGPRDFLETNPQSIGP